MQGSRPVGGLPGVQGVKLRLSTGTEEHDQGPARLWGIVLAGGEGRRVRPLMRRLSGTDLPKQYCAVIGRRSMLQHTLDRVATSIDRDRILTVIIREHARWAREQLPGTPPDLLVVQPSNRETGPGLLLPLLRIHARDPAAAVAVFPADHFILEEAVFMAHAVQAIRFLEHQPGRVLILGIAPDRAETAYGWIEPGVELARHSGYDLLAVRRFREKPDARVAERYFMQGFLWNSLVLVGRVETFLSCIRQVLPRLWASFEAVAPALGTFRESEALEEVYRGLPSVNLSRGLLERIPDRLGTIPVKGVHWSDWGDEQRIRETLARIGKEEELALRLQEARESGGGRRQKEKSAAASESCPDAA